MSDKTGEIDRLTILAATKANDELGKVGSEEGKKLLSTEAGATILSKYEESELNRDNSHKDPLTELLNRRGIKEESERVRKILEREGDYKGFTIIVADMIGLKRINIEVGEIEADNTIKRAADSFSNFASRGTDLVCRWGGDEFVLVLFNQNPQNVPEYSKKMIDEQPYIDKMQEKLKYNVGYKSFGPTDDIYAAIEYCVNQIDEVKLQSPKDETGRVTGDGVLVELNA